MAILITTSCSKSLNKSLSHEQLQQYIDAFPDYPRLANFDKNEQKRIASLPPLFKDWAFETIKILKCLKQNLCE